MTARIHGIPSPPTDIADEVEVWARQSGRHATLRFVPTVLRGNRAARGTWTVRMTLKSDDKRLRAVRDGVLAEEPMEVVWLHEPDAKEPGGYRPYDLAMLGSGGVKAFLDKGNMWSGRGAFNSLADQLRKVNADNAAMKDRNYADAKDGMRADVRDKRRQYLKIPFIRVLMNLKKGAQTATPNGLALASNTKE